MEPTPFYFDLKNFPVFYSTPAQPVSTSMYRRLVRKYYRHIRQGHSVSHDDLVEERFNLTYGMLAMYILYREHQKRKLTY
jgi:hypothetical protein